MSESAKEVILEFLERLKSSDRLLAGGYIFMSDIIGDTSLMNRLGILISNIYQDKEIDAVVTVASKGIPAYSIASVLNKPVVIIREDNKVTEGTTVAINLFQIKKKIETMVLSKKSLETGSKVLLVDDFYAVVVL